MPAKLKFHFVISHEADGNPKTVSCSTIDELKTQLYTELLRVKKGWCFIFVDGERVHLSAPRQVFKLFGAGITVELSGEPTTVMNEDGSFRVLIEAP